MDLISAARDPLTEKRRWRFKYAEANGAKPRASASKEAKSSPAKRSDHTLRVMTPLGALGIHGSVQGQCRGGVTSAPFGNVQIRDQTFARAGRCHSLDA
jgi:hypothetical protein